MIRVIASTHDSIGAPLGAFAKDWFLEQIYYFAADSDVTLNETNETEPA